MMMKRINILLSRSMPYPCGSKEGADKLVSLTASWRRKEILTKCEMETPVLFGT